MSEPEYREVENIKCTKCKMKSEDFEINRIFMCGDDGLDIHEQPACKYCGSTRVIENLAEAK